MIRTLAVTREGEAVTGTPLEKLQLNDYEWVWVDFHEPTPEESRYLESYFHFHPLAVEDCMHILQRPKLDYYDELQFLVLHALNPVSLDAVEVDMFLSQSLVVTFHLQTSAEVDEAWLRVTEQVRAGKVKENGTTFAAYTVMDKLVDQYFPSLYTIEDELAEIGSMDRDESVEELMHQVFELRSRLLKLRRIVVPMRDLLYRFLNSQHVQRHGHHAYFSDIYDHLLKLTDMVEADREMTSDLRDSYISLNSNRMNNIMKTLTVITTVFMPLTLIAGIYGMNFDVMPELHWRFGYPLVLLMMLLLGGGMVYWFMRRGWFK